MQTHHQHSLVIGSLCSLSQHSHTVFLFPEILWGHEVGNWGYRFSLNINRLHVYKGTKWRRPAAWTWMNFNKAAAECLYLLFNEAHHWWLKRQGVMVVMVTWLPLYGVICLVALVPGAVMMMFGKGRRRGGSGESRRFKLMTLTVSSSVQFIHTVERDCQTEEETFMNLE